MDISKQFGRELGIWNARPLRRLIRTFSFCQLYIAGKPGTCLHLEPRLSRLGLRLSLELFKVMIVSSSTRNVPGT